MNSFPSVRVQPAALLMISAVIPLFINGCAQHRQLTTAQSQLSSVTSSVTDTGTEATQVSMASTVLTELELSKTQTVPAQNRPGPQLIAGDWLAWQCALVGNYWHGADAESLFANAPEDQ